MNLPKFIIQGCLSGVIAMVSVLVYFQVVGFSAALPLPEFMLEYAKVHGSASALYDWSFYFLTLSVPFAVYSLAVHLISFKWLPYWVSSLGIFVAMFYVRGFHYGFVHWLSMLILITIVFCVFWLITRNKAIHKISRYAPSL